MTTYFTDPFTGTNGAAWDTGIWTNASVSTTGSSATIQGNKGRLNAGSGSGYSGRKAMRHLTTYADAEITCTFQLANTVDGSVQFMLRSDSIGDGASTYWMIIDKYGSARIGKDISASGTTLHNISFTMTQGPVYGAKFYVVGTSIKGKIWDTSGGEPGSYNLTATDSSITGAGYAMFKVLGGGSSGFIVDFDDAVLTNGVGNQFTYTGAVNSAGALRRAFIKSPFTAAITPAGALIKLKVVTKLVTGAITSAGALRRVTTKLPTGAIAPAGTVRKVLPRTFASTITSSGFYRKAFVRNLAGAITSTGSLTTSWLGRVFGRPGIVRMTVRAAGWVSVRVRRG